ncbi:3-hydroxyacyl-CoA dehydrogenase family protein [Paraburkholderia sp. UYCP14C]|nr:3-hydroxyacyl-CoA dehydrogenase family protein [Paraburkholderia sp. UYCP14C]
MSVGVAGGGLMGCGIATKLALAGVAVQVHDNASGAQDRVRGTCAAVLAELIDAQAITRAQADAAEACIHFAPSLNALAGTSLVIEAIVESLPAKQALYAELERCVPASTCIASSTSGFMPTLLGERMQRPQRFLVAHFWNPPHLIPLVEVVPGPYTEPEVLHDTVECLRQAGCEPVLLAKALPGFIGNRIQFAVLREALHLLREGVADADTIDRVMVHSLGRRYRWFGPLTGADAGGLHTFLQISEHLMPELAKDEEVLDLLRAHVERGEKGRSTGRGIHEWDTGREAQYLKARRRMLD